jgi:hypothetical protein
MFYYHYTSISSLDLILASGALSKGRLIRSSGRVEEPIVWLTKAPTPEGQGVGNASCRPGSAHDKSLIRVKLFIEDKDAKLISFHDFCSQYERPLFGRKLGLAAAYDLHNLTPRQEKSLMFTGTSHESTWSLYRGSISTREFLEVDFLTHDGFEPYSFVLHGKSIMLASGFYIASDEALQDLARLGPTTTKFLEPKAYCHCGDTNDQPNVTIIVDGTASQFAIADGTVISGNAPLMYQQIKKWIEVHTNELQRNWDMAVIDRKKLSTAEPGHYDLQ